VVAVEFKQTFLACLADEGTVQRNKHFRKKRQYVNLHCKQPPLRIFLQKALCFCCRCLPKAPNLSKRERKPLCRRFCRRRRPPLRTATHRRLPRQVYRPPTLHGNRRRLPRKTCPCQGANRFF